MLGCYIAAKDIHHIYYIIYAQAKPEKLLSLYKFALNEVRHFSRSLKRKALLEGVEFDPISFSLVRSCHPDLPKYRSHNLIG